jgi:hypothetical protein
MDAAARSTTVRPDRSEGKLVGASYLAACAAAAHEAAFRAAKGARAAHTEGKRKLVRLLLVHPVVLSRVRTLAGIFLEKMIPVDIDFSPNPDDLEMMESNIAP